MDKVLVGQPGSVATMLRAHMIAVFSCYEQAGVHFSDQARIEFYESGINVEPAFKDERKLTYLNAEGSEKPMISPVPDSVLTPARAYRLRRLRGINDLRIAKTWMFMAYGDKPGAATDG